MEIYAQALRRLQRGEKVTLVTALRASGVSKMLREGDIESPFLTRSGEETIMTECFLPSSRVIIFGGGHIAAPLSHMAGLLKFNVTVFDDRPFFADRRRFPSASEVICESFEKIAERVTFQSGDYVVIVTRGHRHDIDCLRSALSGEAPFYMGMIGSRRRVAIVRQQMIDEGFSQDRVRSLHSPIGLNIGAVTPEEIAVSIFAEIIQEKHKSSPQKQEYYVDMELMEALAQAQEKMALVTVLSTKGSTPREAGAKMAVLYDGTCVGSIGGGCAEADVIRDAREIILSGGYRFKIVDMTDSAEDDGMVCGGEMEVLIEALG
ncbi:xanthine dehydrogenase [Synergistales bacterium]|nr:xanthine dehydrogenase [Synergistales bacterium]